MDIQNAIMKLHDEMRILDLPWEQGKPVLREKALEIATAHGLTRADVLALYFSVLAEAHKARGAEAAQGKGFSTVPEY